LSFVMFTETSQQALGGPEFPVNSRLDGPEFPVNSLK